MNSVSQYSTYWYPFNVRCVVPLPERQGPATWGNLVPMLISKRSSESPSKRKHREVETDRVLWQESFSLNQPQKAFPELSDAR